MRVWDFAVVMVFDEHNSVCVFVSLNLFLVDGKPLFGNLGGYVCV